MVFADPSHADQVLARTRAVFGGPRRAPLTETTVAAARQALDSQRLGWQRYLAFAGPAVVASIAYMDPGNFATNIQAGAKYGYGLLWVCAVTRRRFPAGASPTRRFAPAGSNRSRYGGDEMSEAFG